MSHVSVNIFIMGYCSIYMSIHESSPKKQRLQSRFRLSYMNIYETWSIKQRLTFGLEPYMSHVSLCMSHVPIHMTIHESCLIKQWSRLEPFVSHVSICMSHVSLCMIHVPIYSTTYESCPIKQSLKSCLESSMSHVLTSTVTFLYAWVCMSVHECAWVVYHRAET